MKSLIPILISLVIFSGCSSSNEPSNGLNAQFTLIAGSGAATDFYRSTDHGSSWQTSLVPNRNITTPVYSIVSSGSDLYGVSYGVGLLHSSDNGYSWFKTDSVLERDLYAVTIKGNSVFVGGGSIYRSNDSCKTWQTLTGLSGNTFRSFAVLGNRIFAGAYTGGVISMSSDNGDHWTQVSSGQYGIETMLADGPDLYAGTNGGTVLHSSDSGMTWNTVSLTIGLNAVSALIQGQGNIYAALVGAGVFGSSDRGKTWMPDTNGFGYRATDNRAKQAPNHSVDALATTGPYLFAATNGKGIFYSTNQGSSWSSLDALGDTSITSLCIR